MTKPVSFIFTAVAATMLTAALYATINLAGNTSASDAGNSVVTGDAAGIPVADPTIDLRAPNVNLWATPVMFDTSNLSEHNADGGVGVGWRWSGATLQDVNTLADKLGVTGVLSTDTVNGNTEWTLVNTAADTTLVVSESGYWEAHQGDREPAHTTCVAPETQEYYQITGFNTCDVPLEPLPTPTQLLEKITSIFGDDITSTAPAYTNNSAYIEVEYLINGKRSGVKGHYRGDTNGWSASGMVGVPVRQGNYRTLPASRTSGRLTDTPDTPDVEATVITLTKANPKLVSVVDATNTIWSLPGYVYTDTNNVTWETTSVAPTHITTPDTPARHRQP